MFLSQESDPNPVFSMVGYGSSFLEGRVQILRVSPPCSLYHAATTDGLDVERNREVNIWSPVHQSIIHVAHTHLILLGHMSSSHLLALSTHNHRDNNNNNINGSTSGPDSSYFLINIPSYRKLKGNGSTFHC